MKQLMTGNEAIARGLYEAGAVFCSAYPGTPSTEILENLPQYREDLYCEWAPNEKVAVEAAYGASIAGARSASAMKHVGFNVAADPIFTAAYNGVGGGFVLISADDPGMHSSQNEQDNRHYARAAKIPMLEPADSAECKDFVAEAYRISEHFDIPVLLRVTTRVCHSKSLVAPDARTDVPIKTYARDIAKYVSTPANAIKHHPELEAKLEALADYSNDSALNYAEINGGKIGVVAASVAWQYAKEAFPKDASFFKAGLTHPLPIERIRAFAAQVETLYVVEELDPFMEEQIRAAGIACVGKEKIPAVGELNPQIVAEALFGVVPEVADVPAMPAPRPPVLCPGCPHRGFFYTVSKVKDAVVAGDIGCYTLGCAPPLNAIESCVCMGGGFTVAAGMAKVFERTGDARVVFGVMGDSTFMHSGLTGACEIIYNGAKVIPCVLDNSITAMTGQQDNPSTGRTLMGAAAPVVSIVKMFEACGFARVLSVDPQDLAAMRATVEDAIISVTSGTPTAIVTKRPCLLIKGLKFEKSLCAVDAEKCKKCKMCTKVGCPAVFMGESVAEIDATLCTGCTVCEQACPFGAISTVA